MAEIAGLVVGIVPLVITTTKICHSLKNRFEIMRERDNVVRRMSIQFRGLQVRFRESARRLFRPEVPSQAEWNRILGEEPRDETLLAAKQIWTDKWSSIESALSERLGCEKADLLQEYLKEIVQLLKDAEADLSTPRAMHERNCQGLDSTKRQAVRLVWNKEQIDEVLLKLRGWIDDFQAFVEAEERIPPPLEKNLPLPWSINKAREASIEFFDALRKAWTCRNKSHGGHEAGLLVKVEVDATQAVHMSIAITCRHSSGVFSQANPIETPRRTQIDLEVESVSIMPPPSRPKKRIKTTENSNGIISSSTSAELDLKHLQSICCHFSKVSAPFSRGLLGSGSIYRHLVHSSHMLVEPRGVPLSQALKSISEGLQLKMAQRLATTVLQFHSTPWLAPNWRLGDTSVAQISSSSQTQQLAIDPDFENIHLIRPLPDATVTGRKSFNAQRNGLVDELGELLGVRNWTLCNLGIALIELAYQKPITELRDSADDGDVLTARKVAKSMKTSFGFKYNTIVRRCLYSDFVPDVVDLSAPLLQTAVYNEVVKPLEDMFEDFKRLSLQLRPTILTA